MRFGYDEKKERNMRATKEGDDKKGDAAKAKKGLRVRCDSFIFSPNA
jgi:hypothetical protein